MIYILNEYLVLSHLEIIPLTLFSMALCDDHTPHAASLTAFCHNLANIYQNSNFDIAGAWTDKSLVSSMK